MRLDSSGKILRFGPPAANARGAMILLHGRGSNPEEIAGLATEFPSYGLSFLAPAARGGSWYPNRFLAPCETNEPWLSEAIGLIEELVSGLIGDGLPEERIAIAGFSQGGCLALEYSVRHPRRYQCVAGLSGALIGPLDRPRPAVRLSGVPVLLACAQEDSHIPQPFVERSAAILSDFGANVTKMIFPGASHRIYPEEIDWLRQQIGRSQGPGAA
jgi:phospholipase/carboxylesterase